MRSPAGQVLSGEKYERFIFITTGPSDELLCTL
jgi:hypothetical protein